MLLPGPTLSPLGTPRAAAAPVGGTTYADEVLADSPVAYYRLGDSSGTTATDSSGNSRNGTYTHSPTLGATGLITGDFDTAVTLASGNLGTSANAASAAVYVDCGNLSAFNFAAPFSLELWIKCSAPTSNTYGMLIAKSAGTGVQGYEVRFNSSTGKLQFVCVVAGTEYTADGGTVLASNTKYHVVAVRTSTTIDLYLNGTLDGTTTISGTPTAATSESLLIGLRALTAQSGQFPLNATVDEVAAYNAALSSTRIAAHYTTGV